jgi:predicted RNase H-like HicB family nuclease
MGYNFAISTIENGTKVALADDLAGVPLEAFETYEEAETEAEIAIMELGETRPDLGNLSYEIYETRT